MHNGRVNSVKGHLRQIISSYKGYRGADYMIRKCPNTVTNPTGLASLDLVWAFEIWTKSSDFGQNVVKIYNLKQFGCVEAQVQLNLLFLAHSDS